MSAFLVSNDHINAIVTFGTRHLPADAVDRAALARMLTDENMRSLNARYGDTADEQKAAAEYAYAPPLNSVDATQIVMLCDCYDYQACETDNYEATPAAAFVVGVRKAAIDAGGKTAGALYNSKSWGI